ncbi:MAG: glycosyl hydrolase family 32 [Verrucomicrobia bacterium]|nr:glycosyl hydrolase family 32 [Verrucomicrobiota bacterium]
MNCRSFLLTTAAVCLVSLHAAETLPNGIVLPREWPPASGDPKSRAPMAVPYLQAPPAVIPIDVGRQLFVDDFLIASTDLKRTLHSARKLGSNPVFRPTTPEEIGPPDGQRAVCYLGHGGVFFDPAAQLFKMWYTADWRGGLALATSRDALRWERPQLGLAGGNLILARNSPHVGGDNCVWLDTNATNPAERVKFLADHTGKRQSHFFYTIADDGRVAGDVSAGKAGDYCSFFYNPFRRVWVYSIKRSGPYGRNRYYAESPVYGQAGAFDRSVYWTDADELDKPDPRIGDAPQLYSLSAVAYESILLGAFQIHLGPRNSICELGNFPKFTDLKLGFSRDGFHWARPDRRAFIGATRREGDWDRGYVHTTAGVCLVVGDQLYFPYCAYSGIGPDGHRGMYTGASVGLAVLRRDGFASMDAGERTGTLTTRPVVFQGSRLFVNSATAKGELRVEVLDENGQVIAPFGAAACQAVSADATLQEVSWEGAADLSALRGRPVRFRFHLRQGSLFAFWVSPDASGASHGYVGAGGPGYPGVVDTVGRAALTAGRR